MNKLLCIVIGFFTFFSAIARQTQKPVLHGKNWMAVTGKPLAATAGALIFDFTLE